MTSRERARKAIHFEGPDRIPHFLPDGKHNDLVWLWPAQPEDVEPWTPVGGGMERKTDAWGSVWQRLGPEGNGEVVQFAIPDISRQSEICFPEVNSPAVFEPIRRAVQENDSQADPKYCLGVMPLSSLNEGTHRLTGLENMFLGYYEQPEALKTLIGRLAETQRRSIRSLAECGCDGVMGYDDWGLQDRLMVGLETIEEFFLPHYRQNWALAHELGMDVWLHSCGHILELLPRLIEAGLDVIQMDQQENMTLEALDAAAGGRIAFWCPVDIQQTMIHGTIDDVQGYVRRMVATVGAHKGGLVSMAYSTPTVIDHDPKKIAAMCEAFRKYGVY
jgi:hypothetical protein